VRSELEANLATSRRWLWIAALVGLVVGGGAITWNALRDRGPALRKDASRRPAPPPRGAFATGGKPRAADPALEHALQETLADWVIALDQLTAAARDSDPAGFDRAQAAIKAAREALRSPEVANALGRDGALRLDDVLDRAHDAAAAATEQDARRESERFLDAIGAFNDALAASGHGFFLDGDVIVGRNSRRIVLMYSFRVVHVSLFDAGPRRIRALQLRRLDHLNWSHSLLGFTSPHLREALVLLDQVDELLVNYVLPALAPDADVELFDDDSADPNAAWQQRVRRRAGEVIRAEYSGEQEQAPIARLGELLHARRGLFGSWARMLEPRGIALREPRTLRIEDFDAFRQSMADVVPDDDLDALDDIERELHAAANDRVFASVRNVIIASVERHEVQHRIDAALPEARRVPGELEEYTGPLLDRRGKPRATVSLARDELSAYLAELARDPLTTRVNLTLISRFLFDRERWGSAECYAALVIFEGLAAQAGIELDGELVENGEIDRERVADIYLALSAQRVQDLRNFARTLWERLFDAPLPDIDIVHNDRDGQPEP
jgi:hypothetical protein